MMRLKDFEYDGVKLSSFGLIPASFNEPSDAQDIGNRLSMSETKVPNSDRVYSVGTTYEGVFKAEFDIFKFDCKYIDFVISEDEINKITRWLNRKSYYKFKPIYENGEFADVYFMATFNINLIKVGSETVGLSLEMFTDSPYGYIDEKTFRHTFTDNDSFNITDTSDEARSIYTTTTVKCLSAGDLRLENLNDKNNVVIVKNCKIGETITLYGNTKTITSSLSHPKLPNDFNYNYLRIVNTYKSNENIITCNLNAEISISYSPIRKVGLIL